MTGDSIGTPKPGMPRPSDQDASARQQTYAWCQSTWPAVYRYAYRLVRNREEAEDITQETYLRAIRAIEKGFPEGKMPGFGYLSAVALNLVRDGWRQKRSHFSISPLEEAQVQMVTAQTPVEPPPYSEEDALLGTVSELMSSLPQEYQTVLELRIVQGYSRAETAALMGKSESAVRGLQYRALLLLKQRLREQPKEVD